MDYVSEIIAAIQSDLTIGDESTLYPRATVLLGLNRAYRKIGGMFKWPDTKDALKTSTVSGQEYYMMPPTWKPGSIVKLTVDSVDYGDPLNFQDYLYEKENNYPSGLTKIWATYGRKYFITPVPTTNGNNNIVVWGFANVPTLVQNTEFTIFSFSMAEVNEAIVLEAVAILKNKGEVQQSTQPSYSSTMLSIEAKSIVIAAWAKVSMDQAKIEKTRPNFNVPDLFGNNRNSVKNNIGNF